MKKGKLFYFVYYFLQLTWSLPQNVLGFILFLYVLKTNKKGYHKFEGAYVIEWNKLYECMGLGLFIFMCSHHNHQDKEIIVHEYGHTIQSLILGPFYLLVIGLPSLIWNTNKKLKKYRRDNNISYYWLYCEKWANKLGEKFTGQKAPK